MVPAGSSASDFLERAGDFTSRTLGWGGGEFLTSGSTLSEDLPSVLFSAVCTWQAQFISIVTLKGRFNVSYFTESVTEV